MIYVILCCWLLVVTSSMRIMLLNVNAHAACRLYQRACSDRDCGCIMHIQLRHVLSYNIYTNPTFKPKSQ